MERAEAGGRDVNWHGVRCVSAWDALPSYEERTWLWRAVWASLRRLQDALGLPRMCVPATACMFLVACGPGRPPVGYSSPVPAVMNGVVSETPAASPTGGADYTFFSQVSDQQLREPQWALPAANTPAPPVSESVAESTANAEASFRLNDRGVAPAGARLISDRGHLDWVFLYLPAKAYIEADGPPFQPIKVWYHVAEVDAHTGQLLTEFTDGFPPSMTPGTSG